MRLLTCALAAVFLVGCAVSGEEGESGTDEVVGVDDIQALEAELGMVHDVRLPNGQWSRDVRKGGCFAQSQTLPVHWEFRRWKTGAAFFEKSAVSREIKCVDVDLAPEHDPGEQGSLALNRLAIDAALRYHLGRVLGPDHAMGSSFLAFEHGLFHGTAGFLGCPVQGEERCGTHQGCIDAVEAECMASIASSSRKQKFYSPSVDGSLLSAFGTGQGSVDPTVFAIVARFAARQATNTSVFDMNADPVGFHVATDGPSGIWSSRTRYTKMDVHASHGPDRDLIVLTGKNLDANPEANALIRCERTRGHNDYDCERPGQFLAPF